MFLDHSWQNNCITSNTENHTFTVPKRSMQSSMYVLTNFTKIKHEVTMFQQIHNLYIHLCVSHPCSIQHLCQHTAVLMKMKKKKNNSNYEKTNNSNFSQQHTPLKHRSPDKKDLMKFSSKQSVFLMLESCDFYPSSQYLSDPLLCHPLRQTSWHPSYCVIQIVCLERLVLWVYRAIII